MPSLTHLGMIAFGVIGVIGYTINDNWMKLASIGVVALILYWLGNKITDFAIKHKDQAMLGGAEFLAIRQAQLGTKEIPNAPSELSIGRPAETGEYFTISNQDLLTQPESEHDNASE